MPPRQNLHAKGGSAKKGTMGRLLKMLFKDFKWQLIVVIICIALSCVAANLSSVFIRNITDEVIIPGLSNGFDAVYHKLLITIIMMASIYVLGLISSFVYNLTMGIVSQKFMNKFRETVFDHMQTLPIKYFDTHSHGDTMSMYTNDIDTIRQLVSQSLPSIISTVFSVAILVGIMLTYSIWLTLLVFLGTLLMFFVSKDLAGKSSKYFVKQQKSLGKVEGYVEEAIHGAKVIKVFNHEEIANVEFDTLNDQLRNDGNNANKFSNIMMPVLSNIGNIIYVAIAIFGAVLVISNINNLTITGFSPLTIGIVISFLTMVKQFSNNVSKLSQQASSIVMALAGASRCFELIDEPSEVDNGYVTLVHAIKDGQGNLVESEEPTELFAWKHPHNENGAVTYTELKGDIRLFDVDFGYNPDKIVLHDIDIYARPGEKIAFVGATGAGKTTITNLINRFYDIADGKIRYDGININKIKKDDLRRSLGIVLQDTNLFTGTVKDNIKYGKLNATDEEVVKAAKIANAYDFITRLPQGFDTMLSGDGANLSQGQRQLLSIARAAIKEAPVMILDEATSSIDTRTEQLVQKGTDKLMEGRTVFVIAHRLSTVQNSDAIMVLDGGKIIERGTHNDLIAKKGVYYQLYTGAFELE